MKPSCLSSCRRLKSSYEVNTDTSEATWFHDTGTCTNWTANKQGKRKQTEWRGDETVIGRDTHFLTEKLSKNARAHAKTHLQFLLHSWLGLWRVPRSLQSVSHQHDEKRALSRSSQQNNNSARQLQHGSSGSALYERPITLFSGNSACRSNCDILKTGTVHRARQTTGNAASDSREVDLQSEPKRKVRATLLDKSDSMCN